MSTLLRFVPVMLGTPVLFAIAVSGEIVQAQPTPVTASSQWGRGYGAAQAADGVADINGNYWQTVQGKDKGAWWQLDLGKALAVRGVKVSWARLENRVHCPPASMAIQVSRSGAEGSWKDVRRIGTQDIPRAGQPYQTECEWCYALPDKTEARFVRLFFPEGAQPGAKYPGYLCLGEVEVRSPGLPSRIVTIEGQFGKAEVDVCTPSLVRLYLRGPNGLSEQSLLAPSGPKPWAHGGYSYVVGEDDRRYESRLERPAKVELKGEGVRTVIQITGVKLAAMVNEEPVATEDWTLSTPGDGAQLIWKITRRWQKDFTSAVSGSPGLFFSFNARRLQNSVTSTIWYDPLRIVAGPNVLYAITRAPGQISENHLQTLNDRDTWAIYKLWTNWHAPTDLRLEVQGGFLYRRGSYALLSEAGAVSANGTAQSHHRGEVEEILLKIAGVDKQTTGYQLAVTLPDKAMEASLKDFYASVLNGGAVNDQKGFDFGNETDGWYYAGSCWMYGMALAAGVPAPGQLSSHPYDAVRAFREHLAHVLSVLDAQGRAHFGYNRGGEWVDDNLHTIIGTHAYLLHSGDLAFVRQNLPALERMLAYFVQRRNDQGLFKLASVGAHWYYDAVSTSGVNGYYNAFFYKAASDLAAMEAAAGRAERANEYRTVAQQIKKAFNAVLWKEDAPGGPRYLDWIDAQGKGVSYFCDLCQWPPIAVGIASPEQARKIVATADARIGELKKEYGYQGFAGLSALWPVPKEVNPMPARFTFGIYMNGGSLLCQSYWEIVARARAGDAEGAYRRLKGFARRAAEICWAGDNAANIKAEMRGGDGEPYLADMVAATAAVLHGVMGIIPTWNGLEVSPHLPAAWPGAEADILYKGRRHHITIENGKARIQPREQVVDLPLLWVMDFNLRSAPGGVATVSNVDFVDPYGGSIALKKTLDDRGALGLWKLEEVVGLVWDASPHQNHGAIAGSGVRRGEAGHFPTTKGYRLDGHGWVTIPDDGSLLLNRSQSFTVQSWFRTEATDNRVMVGKPRAYCVYVKQGKLAAWLMEDGGKFKEALGCGRAADAKWHHVAAVFDRQAQRLSLYLDGKLDTPDGAPGPQNPVDISSLGSSHDRSGVVTIGSLGSGFPFLGWLDEVSVFRGALKPADFSFERDYPSPIGKSKVSYAAAGSYQSPPCDWTIPATLTDLTVAADLHGGQVTATVELSHDGFTTIASRMPVRVRDGVNVYSLDPLTTKARSVRVRFDLRRGPSVATTPVIDGFQVRGKPSTKG